MPDDVSLVLCGEAGQGIQTIEQVLTRLLKLSGYHVFATKEYMSRIRGGVNSTSIRVSSRRVAAYSDRIDILIPLDKGRTSHLQKRIASSTVILGEKDNIDETCEAGVCRIVEVPFSAKALEIGDKLYANTIAIGVVAGLFSVARETVESFLRRYFSRKDRATIENNVQAAQAGYLIGRGLNIRFDVRPDPGAAAEPLLSGAEAMALGALAGGCNFIAAYPMTPATGVMTFLAQQAKAFGLVVEQAEDEIAAMNMALGAWYAGARALVSTSGGGFALMVEGLSLAGMLELPVVINLGQRPGPATGLPTRTEQGDLSFALYAGHGEFPRAILAPGSIEETFDLTRHAFNLADRFQVPVFIMTDQYLMDSYYNVPGLEPSGPAEKYFVESEPGYQRYALTEDGVSPRAIPGYGRGLVAVDSDEHDADGHISEDLDWRVRIVDKRLKKKEGLAAAALAPELTGPADYRTLILGWGSNGNIIKEALARLGGKGTACLHFRQVYPLHPDTSKYLKKASKLIAVENNATGQFCQLLKLQTGFDVGHKILRYDGLPFSVEALSAKIEAIA